MRREYAISVYASESGSKFICFDVDDGDAETVRLVIKQLIDCGMPAESIHVSLSGRKGYHIEVFFESVIRIDRLKRLYEYTLYQSGLHKQAVEFRPTCNQAIKLPLSVHHVTGNVCWFVDRQTLEPIQTNDYILAIQPLQDETTQAVLDKADKVVRSIRQTQEASIEKDSAPKANAGSIGNDSVPYADLTVKGTRHAAMLRMVVADRYNGIDKEVSRERLLAWYERQDLSLIKSSRKEVLNDAETIVDWVYRDSFMLSAGTPGELSVRVSRKDLLLALSQSGKAARKLYFSVVAREKANRSCVSCDALGLALNMHPITVFNALKKMAKKGYIEISHGRHIKLKPDEYRQLPNSYHIRKGISPPIIALSAKCESVSIRMAELMDDLSLVYYRALDTVFGPSQLKEWLTNLEWREYQARLGALRDNENENGGETNGKANTTDPSCDSQA